MRSLNIQVEDEDYARWKRSGLKQTHVFKLGLMNAEGTPGYITRIRELETQNERVVKKLEYAMRRLNEADVQISELQHPQVKND